MRIALATALSVTLAAGGRVKMHLEAEQASSQQPGYQQPGYNEEPDYNQQPGYNQKPGYQHGGGAPIDMNQLENLQLGPPNGPLIPALVPPPGFKYEFKNKEKTRGWQLFFQGVDTNEYKWELDEVKEKAGGRKFEVDRKFAKLKGKWQSNSFGHKSVHVYNNRDEEIFKIRMSKHTWNPFKLRWSFRILPPGSKNKEDALFTVIRDYFGKGFLWMKEEWRVYRGRKRDDDMVYYGIGSYFGYDFKFYRSRETYKAGDKTVLAKMSQKINAGAIIAHNAIPDKFKLEVDEGGDSALLLCVTTIIDMVHDSKGSEEGIVDVN